MTQPLPTAGFWEGTDRRVTGGFSYGLAQELRERLGLERLVIRTEPFSKIVAGRLGDADVALALLTRTSGREKVLSFTTPYLHAAPALLARAGTDIPDVQSAQGLRFVLGRNTTFADIVAERIRPDRRPVELESRTAEIGEVKSGRADVAVFDLPAAQAIAHSTSGLEVAAKFGEAEPVAAALPYESENVEAVSAALREMEADGTLDRLAVRWLGRSLTDLENEVPLLRTQGP